MTLTAVLRRLSVDAVPHGFRSTFRMWAADHTNVAREVVECALAHKLTDKVEEAYQRSDLFVKRQLLMQAWGSYCTGRSVCEIVTQKGDVEGLAAPQ